MADTDVETNEPNQFGSVNPETEPKADIPGVAEKRKPGRPAKAPPVVDTVSTNYQPSVERNELVQAAQPTGTGAVAGNGDWADFDENNLEEVSDTWRPETVIPRMAGLVAKENDSPPPIPTPPADDKLFPVRMLRNYRPATNRWYPILRNGKAGKTPIAYDTQGNPDYSTGVKVPKGFSILVPVSEARELIKRGLAVRADELPL